jgi:aspartate/methionine/tyrosine aminotransferase
MDWIQPAQRLQQLPPYLFMEIDRLKVEVAGIVTTPGNGFGEPGEGYFRISLTVPEERLEEAVSRLKKVGF